MPPDSITISDLFDNELSCGVFNERRIYVRNVETAHHYYTVDKKEKIDYYIILSDTIELNEKESLRQSQIINKLNFLERENNPNYYDRDKLITFSIEEFIEYLKLISKDIEYNENWSVEKNNSHVEQITNK